MLPVRVRLAAFAWGIFSMLAILRLFQFQLRSGASSWDRVAGENIMQRKL